MRPMRPHQSGDKVGAAKRLRALPPVCSANMSIQAIAKAERDKRRDKKTETLQIANPLQLKFANHDSWKHHETSVDPAH